MAHEIKMPQLSDTMSSGKILTWKKNAGDQINRGDILAEVETDKANLEIESFYDGTLLNVLIKAGDVANVGEIIALIGESGEKVAEQDGSKKTSAAKITISNGDLANTDKIKLEATPHAQPEAESNKSFLSNSKISSGTDRVKISPLARKIAEQRQINISNIQGSGPDGRIVRRDVESVSGNSVAFQSETAAPTISSPPAPITQPIPVSRPAPAPASSAASALAGTLTPYTKMRETIARRMQESVTQAPHFYVTCSVNMTQAKQLRELLKQQPDFQGLSYNHMIIKAAAYAIKNEPRVNRAVKNDQIYTPSQINIGIITAVEDGLLIPVVKEADKLALKDLVFEARMAVERARAGRPNASDLVGGTFSISNMGMYDIDSFTAIINPGQGSVLAVAAIKEEPCVINGVVAPGLVMKATISVDHRIIDGIMAGNFLKFFKQALEVPALIML